MSSEQLSLRTSALCLILGSLAVGGFRLAHGDLPAADPEAALEFITAHPAYAVIHLGTILGVLVWMGGIITLVDTLVSPFSILLGRMAAASVLVGAAIFIVDFVIDGVAGQDLARAWAAAAPAARVDLVLADHIAATMLRGTSLIAIVVLWGVPLMLLGPAVKLDGYPKWLGLTGVVVGALTVLASMALLLQPDLFPGVVVYGLLASIVVQLWNLGLGIVIWHRAGVTSR